MEGGRANRLINACVDRDVPEGCLRITRSASARAIYAALLCERSWRAAILPRLLLKGLLRLLGEALRRWWALLLHTLAVVFLGKLALLVWVVLERHSA